MATQQRDSIVLHTSWRGRLTSVIGPLVLLVWGGYGAAIAGFRPFNIVLLVVGAGMALVVLYDYPLWSKIGPAGVERRCSLRTERLAWEEVRAIARPGARQRFLGSGRGEQGEASKHAAGKAGLVAEVGKRPYLLVDRIESQAEHEAIETGLASWAPGMILRAGKPVEGTPPTWLYKRRKQHVEGMVDWQ